MPWTFAGGQGIQTLPFLPLREVLLPHLGTLDCSEVFGYGPWALAAGGLTLFRDARGSRRAPGQKLRNQGCSLSSATPSLCDLGSLSEHYV